MFFLGWLVDYPDPDDFAAPFCDQSGSFPVRLGITNQTLTDLVHQAAIELNSTLRVQLYSQISQSCYDNAYYLWTVQPVTFHVERTWVSGYTYNPAFAGQIFSYYSKG
jgi:peptide/nickel transport system substrate-binding protein